MRMQSRLENLRAADSRLAPRSTVQLIPDCLEHIFTFLPKADKGRVAQVSRLWKSTCYRARVWKNETANVRLSHMTTRPILHSIRKRGIRKLKVKDHRGNLPLLKMFAATMKSLDISGCQYTTDEMMTSVFQETKESWSELETLSLNYCSKITEDGLHIVLRKMPNLRELNIKGCNSIKLSEMTTTSDDDSTSLKLCENLEHLSIAGCKSMTSSDLTSFFKATGAERIKSLDMQDCDHMCDCSIEVVSNMNLQHLEYLNLSFCVSITDKGLQAIADGVPSLQILLLQSVDNITSQGISHVVRKCSKLKTLDLSNCGWVDNETMELISQARTPCTLEELDLSCADITDVGIKTVAENLHRLKHLRVGQCLKLSDVSLMYIGYHMTNLVSIDIYGCGFSGRAINSIWDTVPSLQKVNLTMLGM